MKKIVVLGCGLVGRVIAEDLSKKFDVTSVDFSQKNLFSKVKKMKSDGNHYFFLSRSRHENI